MHLRFQKILDAVYFSLTYLVTKIENTLTFVTNDRSYSSC